MQKDFNDSSKKLADLKEAEANSLGNTLGPLICGAPIDCSSQDGTIDGLEAKLVVLGKALRKLKQQFNAQHEWEEENTVAHTFGCFAMPCVDVAEDAVDDSGPFLAPPAPSPRKAHGNALF